MRDVFIDIPPSAVREDLIALVAAAAGMALKNRDKLSQMRNKGTNTSTGVTPLDTGANNAPMPPSTPAA